MEVNQRNALRHRVAKSDIVSVNNTLREATHSRPADPLRRLKRDTLPFKEETALQFSALNEFRRVLAAFVEECEGRESYT